MWVGNHVEEIKWTAEDWQEIDAGRLPFREAPEMWEVGDVDAAYEAADLKLDETVGVRVELARAARIAERDGVLAER